MLANYKFFQNQDCEYFPCHKVPKNKVNNFSCLTCFCPLHHYENCGGKYVMLDNGWKDCSQCLIPHYDYDYIMSKLVELHNNQH